MFFFSLLQSHVECFYRAFIEPLLALKVYAESVGNADDAALYSRFLGMMRGNIEKMQPICPGSLNASGAASVAVISRALGDRDLNDELQKMEAALEVATKLGFLPIDVCILKRTIGEWKGDSHMVSEAATKLREHGWIRDAVKTEQIVEGLLRGDVKPGIDSKTSDATADEPANVVELRKQIAAARRAANVADEAGDVAGEDFARLMVKKLKKELKVLTGVSGPSRKLSNAKLLDAEISGSKH